MPIKVLYAADCEMQVITVHKGLDNYTFSEWIDDSIWLQDVFAAAGDIEWRHVKIYDVMPEFPTTLEEMRAFDVIILSDVGVNSLQLLPSFRPPHAVPMGENRLDNLRRFVEEGGGLLMCGGYFSFSGYSGRAGFSGHAGRGGPAGPLRAGLRRPCGDDPGLRLRPDRGGSFTSHHRRAALG